MERTIEIKPTVKELAKCFAHMNDEDQAQFFVEVAAEMGTWGNYKRDMQLCYIGSHLAKCDCVTEDARDLIKFLASHLTEVKPLEDL